MGQAIVFALEMVGIMLIVALPFILILLFLFRVRKPKKVTVWLTKEQREALDRQSNDNDLEERMHQIAQDEAIGIAMWDLPKRK